MKSLLLTLLVLVAVSVSMTMMCVGYCAVFPVNLVPGPEDTPAMKAAGALHNDGLAWLMLGAMLSWLVTFAAGLTTVIMWVAKRKRTRTEDMR